MKFKGLFNTTVRCCLSVMMVGIAWLLLAQAVAAQAPSPLRFTHLTPNEGLPGRHVLAIRQDQQGFMWFGTEDGGLNRFDRETETFTAFRHEPSNPQSVSSNLIRAITITPPWWQTWAFRIALGLTLAGLVVGGIVARDRAIRQHNRELAAQVTARMAEIEAVNAQLQAEAAERERSESQYRLLAENMADVVWVLDAETSRFNYVSPSVERLRGYTPEEVLAQPIEEVITPPSLAHINADLTARVARFMAGDPDAVTQMNEIEQYCKDGSRVWTEVSTTLVLTARETLEVIGVSRDITERHQIEAALRESEERFRLAFEYSGAGMCLVGLDGRFLQINQRMGEMFGYTSAEMVGMHVNDLSHPDYIDVSPTFIEEATAGSTHRAEFEKLYYHRDGHLIWGQVVSSLVRDAQGEPRYFISHVLDITERKQAETRLRESEERFAAVMNSMEAIIYVADMTTYELLFVNQYTRNFFGDVVGQICWQTVQVGQSGPCAFCTNPQLLTEDGEPVGIVSWEMQNTINGRWYHIQDQAIRWTDGRMVRLEVAADITEIKETERQVLAQQRQLATLEERERIGRELHDDLGQVMGYVNVQAQTALDLLATQQTLQAEAALRQLVQVAQAAHSDVREYILGIRQPGAPERDFCAALDTYVHALQQRYGLRVQLHLLEPLPPRLFAPEVEIHLLRILQEALTNVARHAGVDEAHVTLALDDDWGVWMIEDDGVGFTLALPPAAAPEDAADPAHFGLTIMRERAAAIGGRLEISTAPHAGTRLTVRVPRAFEPPAPTGTDAAGVSGLRVLLVDDHPLFLEGLRNMLSARGIQVVGMAHDGAAALPLARQLRPAVILMDVNMPRCDGVTATRNILAEMPDIKIVMLTVAADDDTLFAALKSGASGYLLKNLDSATLFNLLSELMRGEVVIAPGLASRVLLELAREEDAAVEEKEDADDASSRVQLTSRQLEVLQLIAQGLTYKEIGQRLYITERTVKYHMGQIMERLHLKNREQVALYAQQEGLLEP